MLRGRGYFGSHTEATIDEMVKPLIVTFKVDTGPLFLLKSVDIQIADRIEKSDARHRVGAGDSL